MKDKTIWHRTQERHRLNSEDNKAQVRHIKGGAGNHHAGKTHKDRKSI